MYENYDLPLPDLNAYLDRIAIDAAAAPDPDFLKKLVFAHQTHIPFEDIDEWRFHKRIPLEIPFLFDKMVVRRRGGFCFEQNLLFTRALKDLGFDAYTVFCRVLWYTDNDEIPPCTHCAVIVNFPEGPYLCDVGFGGPQPRSALPVYGGGITEEPDAFWKIVPYDDQWFTLSRKGSEGSWKNVIQFSLFRQTPQDFIPLCDFCAMPEDSFFRQNLLVNLRTETGFRSISNDVYSRQDGDSVSTVVLGSWEETLKTLREEFEIRV